MKSKKIPVLFLILLSLTILFTGCGRAKDKTMKAKDSTSANYSDESSGQDSQDDISNEPILPAESTITPAMWKVSDSDGNVIYMMGSIHLADIEAAVFPDYFEEAYATCDSLAVECDITNMNANIFSMYKQMMYTDGTTIADHVSKDSYEKAVEIFKKAGQYSSSYDYMKPIVWVELVETIAAGNSGLSEQYGVDSNLIKRAKSENKEILEVESVQFQTNLLFNMPDDIQNVLFDSIAEDEVIEESAEELKELYENWKKGTITEDEVTEEVDETEDMTEEEKKLLEQYNNILLYDRNIGMRDAALSYMKDGKKVMFVVGAAHFYGDKGILHLMEDAGCTVERISPEADTTDDSNTSETTLPAETQTREAA